MKKDNMGIRKLIVSLCMGLSLTLTLSAGSSFPIEENVWKIQYEEKQGTVDFLYKGEEVLKGVYVKAKVGTEILNSTDYTNPVIEQEGITDEFGIGQEYTVTYAGTGTKPTLIQKFYFYPDKEYFLTEAYVEHTETISSNYIAPILTETRSAFLKASSDNRILSVPFDNDGWIRYSAFPLTTDSVSFEVTAMFDGVGRKGLVLGSVEHDVWKTGIRYATSENQYMDRLECFGGITHKLTRDVDTGTDGVSTTTKEHGAISGKRLKSPKVLVGVFDDWRRGMEAYGEANALITPPRSWTRGVPFGWNSWGAMATNVNAEGVKDVSDFIYNELQPRGFENEGVTFIGLDSYWNERMTNSELRAFVNHCNAKGQEAGIYWTPFSDWSWNGDRSMEGTDGQYQYKDAYLYADGEIRTISARSLDPTHPGTKLRIKDQIATFKRLGFKYIKLDFMNNGIQEADSFYEEGITTGVQAYNHGMQYFMEECGDDMFLALSIAPSFPSQYAHSRRISCDVWGAMNDVWNWTGSTEYLLNSLSFGWWLDRVYAYNDGDHIVLYDEAANREYSEGENRARITSAAMTGLYMLGDNYSQKGSFQGTQMARDRALQFATNSDINDIARIGKSFYPLEGYTASSSNRAESIFMLDTEEYLYLSVFNFSANAEKQGEIEFSRLGITKEEITRVKELWTGEGVYPDGEKISYSVPAKDVRVYRLQKKDGGGSNIETDKLFSLNLYVKEGSELIVDAPEKISSLSITSVEGKLLFKTQPRNRYFNMDISFLNKGIYIASVTTEAGRTLQNKFLR